jgi:hypothetical protein
MGTETMALIAANTWLKLIKLEGKERRPIPNPKNLEHIKRANEILGYGKNG